MWLFGYHYHFIQPKPNPKQPTRLFTFTNLAKSVLLNGTCQLVNKLHFLQQLSIFAKLHIKFLN